MKVHNYNAEMHNGCMCILSMQQSISPNKTVHRHANVTILASIGLSSRMSADVTEVDSDQGGLCLCQQDSYLRNLVTTVVR